MEFFGYKDQSDSISKPTGKNERDSAFSDQIIESRLQETDLISQNASSIIYNFVSSALTKYKEKNYDIYFDQIRLIISFLDELFEAETDFNTILSIIFDENFNYCLIKSINPKQFHVQNVNEILSLITVLSSYPKNYEFFQENSILKIAYNLLELNDEVLFQNSFLIINKYISTYDTEQFPLDIHFLVTIIKNLSKNVLFSQYCVEAFHNLILYVDASKYLNEILILLNSILLKSTSICSFNEIINTIKNIFDMDPLNFSFIFQSRIIHSFLSLISRKFIKKQFVYQKTIELFFSFINHSFEYLNDKWQEIIIKLIGIDSIILFFEKIRNVKILFIIHLIFIQFINSRRNFEEIRPFIAYIIQINIVSDLIKKFQEQAFKTKKLIITIIHKLLKTRSYEIFAQLLKNEEANYFESLSDFITNCDDNDCQIYFLESLIFLFQISEGSGERDLLFQSQAINDFASNCIMSDNEKIQILAQEYLNLLNKE